MISNQDILNHGTKGYAVALQGVEKTVSFCKLIPLTADAVIGGITHVASVDHYAYEGDEDLIGLPLTKGVAYPLFGTSVTMSTGSAMLIRY